MAFDLVKALEDGFKRLTDRVGMLLVGLFVGLALVRRVVWDSFVYQFLIEVIDWEQFMTDLESQSTQSVEDPLANGFGLSILDLPLEVLGLLLAVLAVVGLVLQVGAIRTFTSNRTEQLPQEFFTRRIVLTVLNLILGGILYAIIVTIGILFLIVPGIFLAVALFFYNFEIIVEDKNAISALSGSWELTEGHRLKLFALGLIVVVLEGTVSSIVGTPFPAGSASGAVVGSAVSGALTVVGISIASQAYNQLRGKNTGLPTGSGPGAPTGTTPGGSGQQGGYGQGQPPNRGPGGPPNQGQGQPPNQGQGQQQNQRQGGPRGQGQQPQDEEDNWGN